MNKDQLWHFQFNWNIWKIDWRDFFIKKDYEFIIIRLIFLCWILFIFCYSFFDKDPWKSLLLGITGSLIASIIFTTVLKIHEEYAFQAIQEVFVEKSIEKLEPRLSKLIENTSDKLSLKIDYLPDRVFEASNSPSKAFEEHMLSNVDKSNKIVFKGVSALFHTKRLISLFEGNKLNFNKKIQILLLNPDNWNLLLSHESFRLHYQNEGSTKDIDITGRAKKLQKEILTVIFKLCAITDKYGCNLDVRFHNELAVSRIEIFDDGIYLSYYDKGKPFPGTQYFNKASKVYDSYHTNLTYYFENQDKPDFSLIHYRSGNKFEGAVSKLKPDNSSEAYKLLSDFENLVKEKEHYLV